MILLVHPVYTEVTNYSPHIMGLRWVWFHVCELVTVCAFVTNFLPDERRFTGRKLLAYRFLVHYLAALSLNWRHCLPSLNLEFMGFRHRSSATGKYLILKKVESE